MEEIAHKKKFIICQVVEVIGTGALYRRKDRVELVRLKGLDFKSQKSAEYWIKKNGDGLSSYVIMPEWGALRRYTIE